MTTRTLVTASVLVATTCADGAWADEPRRFTLEWSAPPACPTADAVRANVERLLGAPTAPRIRHVVGASGSVTEMNGQARLVLETTEDGLRGQRTIDGATCDEVTSAGALVVALAVDPDAVREHASSAATGAFAADGSVPPPPPPAANCPPTVIVAPALPTPVATPALPSERPPEARRAIGLLEARGALDVGSLPEPSFGMGLGAGFAIRRFRVRLGATYLLPRFGEARTNPVARSTIPGADVSLLLGDLSGCYAIVPGSVEANVCVGFETGALAAVGRDFAVTRSALEPWLAGTGGLELETLAIEPLAIRVNVGAAVPFGRSPVQFHDADSDSSHTIYQPAVVALRAVIGLGLAFW